MLIRLAISADVADLAALMRKTYADAWGPTMTPVDLADRLGDALSDASIERYLDDDTFLVAESDGRLIGFVQFGAVSIPMPDLSPRDRELIRLYVLARFQRQGLGGRLLQAALDHPQLRAAANIYLETWDQNLGAQRLYERHGFAMIGERNETFPSGLVSRELAMVRRRPR